MRAAYRQQEAGPIVNLALHPRGTAYVASAQAPKWQNNRWAADGVYSLLTGISGHPEGITTAVRLTVNVPRVGHGFDIAGNPESPGPELVRVMPVKPGERITATCWLRYTGTTTQAYRLRFRATNLDGSAWLDPQASVTSSVVSLPSGAWVRLTSPYTVPPGAGFVSIFCRNDNGIIDAVGDTFDGTGLMVTRTPTPTPQANIASDPNATTTIIPTGRFGWTPRWFGGGTSTGTTTQVVGATDGPNGITTYLRKTWTAVGASVQDVAYTHTANGVRATQGEVLTISSYLRASKGWTVTQHCRLVIAWYDGSGVQIGANVFGPNTPTVIAGAWHKLSITATAPANTITMFAYQSVYVENVATWAPGDTIDGTGLTVTRNPPIWKFADGSSPGWKWVGAANTSESVGYSTQI